MKKMTLLAGALSLALLMAGCTAGEPEPQQDEAVQQPAAIEIEYTNLADSETQQQLVEIMTEAGVARDRQEAFLTHVDQFNEIMKPEELTRGYEKGDALTPKYDPYALQDVWDGQHPDFMGYNCRITAFTLFSDFMTIPENASAEDVAAVLFDLQSLEADPSAFPGREDQFAALYANVPTDSSRDVETHLADMQKAWADRGVAFADAPGVRLISMVFHDMLDEEHPTLFVGHTGLLFPVGEQELYFVEKLAFQEPYQCIRFESREELNDYLMSKYDLDVDQPNAAPFIMENGRMMEGYRSLREQ